MLDTQCDGSIIVHRGHDWTLLASGRDTGGCMESVYISCNNKLYCSCLSNLCVVTPSRAPPLFTYTSELLKTQDNCMLYGCYIPLISMITSCLSSESVSKE